MLCGCLFGLPVAFTMTLAAGTIGASLAYTLSNLIGRPIVVHFTDKLQFMQTEVEKRRENLVFFMLFLRVSPLLPNWFVNLSSPIVGIPFHIFFLTTLVGIAPQVGIVEEMCMLSTAHLLICSTLLHIDLYCGEHGCLHCRYCWIIDCGRRQYGQSTAQYSHHWNPLWYRSISTFASSAQVSLQI